MLNMLNHLTNCSLDATDEYAFRVCECVNEREREGERKRETNTQPHKMYNIIFPFFFLLVQVVGEEGGGRGAAGRC